MKDPHVEMGKNAEMAAVDWLPKMAKSAMAHVPRTRAGTILALFKQVTLIEH